MVPIAAALGYATSVIHIYSLGVFIEPIAKAFGWTRTEVAVGLTISTLIQAFISIPVGLAVDRFGPRPLALLGALLTAAAFANIGNATGSHAQWYLSWVLMSAATIPVQATVWTSAVASRFKASRGLSLAVTMCGASVALALFPTLGTRLIESYGWRTAMRLEAAIWIAIAWPVIALFFRGARDRPRKAAEQAAAPKFAGASLAEGLESTIYLRLFVASLLFTFTIIGLNVHFPLVLKSYGFTPLAAAATASLIGLSSIVGRLATGVMLDWFRGSLVGAAAFLMPALACAVLLLGGGTAISASIAALLIGLTLGAEIDVIVYLVTHYFGLRSFGALYGGMLAALSLGTAFGPLLAARIFDTMGSYVPFLWLTIGCMILSSLSLVSLPSSALRFREV